MMKQWFSQFNNAVELLKDRGRLEHMFADINSKVWLELVETGDMLITLQRLSMGQEVSQKEQQAALNQAKDLAKTIPAFGVFMLPGGLVLLPILAKIVPWDVLPSSFISQDDDKSADEGIVGKPTIDK